jgi:hypothetical protein
VDLEADLRTEILAYLPAPERDVAAWLKSMPTGRLLECFLTLRGRVIHPHPRALRVSAELQANPLFAALDADIRILWQKIADGVDLAPHLSRRLGTSYLQDFRRPRDLDILLSEWNIHHLHIAHASGPEGYTERGNNLLFAIVRDDAVYCLDILPRAGWRLQKLAEIALRNWPGDGLLHRLTGAVAEPQPATKDRARGRAGLNTHLVIGGQSYVSNTYGLGAGASPSHVTVAAMKLLGLISYFAENPGELEREVRAANARFSFDWPLMAQFRLVIARTARAYEFVIVENHTKLMMALNV